MAGRSLRGALCLPHAPSPVRPPPSTSRSSQWWASSWRGPRRWGRRRALAAQVASAVQPRDLPRRGRGLHAARGARGRGSRRAWSTRARTASGWAAGVLVVQGSGAADALLVRAPLGRVGRGVVRRRRRAPGRASALGIRLPAGPRIERPTTAPALCSSPPGAPGSSRASPRRRASSAAGRRGSRSVARRAAGCAARARSADHRAPQMPAADATFPRGRGPGAFAAALRGSGSAPRRGRRAGGGGGG